MKRRKRRRKATKTHDNYLGQMDKRNVRGKEAEMESGITKEKTRTCGAKKERRKGVIVTRYCV